MKNQYTDTRDEVLIPKLLSKLGSDPMTMIQMAEYLEVHPRTIIRYMKRIRPRLRVIDWEEDRRKCRSRAVYVLRKQYDSAIDVPRPRLGVGEVDRRYRHKRSLEQQRINSVFQLATLR